MNYSRKGLNGERIRKAHGIDKNVSFRLQNLSIESFQQNSSNFSKEVNNNTFSR